MAAEDIIVGLDIGTSKIAAIIGNAWQGDPEKIEIIGVGTAPSEGLRKGVVIDIDLTTTAIRQAIETAELMAGVQIGSVYAGIAGGHITGQTSHGLVAVSGEGHEITQSDVERAINAAQVMKIPVEREILHVIPQGFIVDDQKGIKDPVGMSGVRLVAYVHIITGAIASAQNLIKSIYNAGISVEDIILEPIASSEAVLKTDEKAVGIALADMGGGTTDVVVYKDGTLRHSAVLSLGGYHITNDIAQLLQMTPQDADKIKLRYGCAAVDLVDQNDAIQISTARGMHKQRFITRRDLAEIIQCRMDEFLHLIGREIGNCKLSIPAGVVLTGGTALLDGLLESASQTFPCPVRVGYPYPLKGLTEKIHSPIYATGVGLVLGGAINRYRAPRRTFIKGTNLFDQIFKRMKHWFQDWL